MLLVERVITVEYLAPCMAEELLCKFPDISAFGFDYSQSGIWSPLLPRGRCRSRSNGWESRLLSQEKLIRKKKRKKTMQGSFRKKLDFSPNPIPNRSTGLNRLFKAASKRLKSQNLPSFLRILPSFKI
ncbi:hypothetical protein AXF42_Ash001545 [Apostasia shenzhenica]|uniref:Uncharacterized protein n=1 Tax=Apostasia shenzhenica TaxID=1088818 RepID=A0A2I0AAJ3_9ASPA|nr:hypothetical protein AXF42_Ash001545 [Apostasia shenzhenica]